MKCNTLFLIFLLSVGLVYATTGDEVKDLVQETKNIFIPFNQNHFHFQTDTHGMTTILSDSIAIYETDYDAPGLPFVPLNICVFAAQKIDGFTFEMTDRFVEGNIDIAPNPKLIRSDGKGKVARNFSPKQYYEQSYPIENVQYKGENIIGNYKILSFLVCPFKYDNRTKTLTFCDRMNMKINLKNETSFSNSNGQNEHFSEILRSIAFNNDEITSREAQNNQNIRSGLVPIEYMIITQDSLKNSFRPLAEWKKKKGVNSKIMTISEIDSIYSTGTSQQKIKQCLRDYYNQGLKYALLGGDSEIVPSQNCAAYLTLPSGYEQMPYEYNLNDMPTDLYYACYGGNFYWNANGNDSIGEPEDNVSLIPSIYLTRAPIRNSEDVRAFSNKILGYEQAPNENGWNNNLLMCGNILENYVSDNSNQSDAEAQGDNLYTSYIQPYWNGDKYKLYDSGTDFDGGASYALNAQNLQYQLSQGYTFVDMITHGDYTLWYLEGSRNRYEVNCALRLSNPNYTVITTSACSTNKFDEPTFNPCLSEGFIRNPNNGVVAYLGCSELGVIYGGTPALGPSLQYEAQFYKILFSFENEKKSFGRIVAYAKSQMISSCSESGPWRWIQFGLNPIGDPEMPIYISTPMEFENITISLTSNGFRVDTGVSGSTICVMSSEDNGSSYYQVSANTSSATFSNVNTDVSICVSKQGYIPKVIEYKDIIFVQNDTLTSGRELYGGTVIIGSNVTSSIPSGNVLFNGGSYKIKGRKVKLQNGTKINIGTHLEINRN